MKAWLPGSILFIVLSGLVSYFFEASFVVAPSIVAAIYIVSCLVHYPEEGPGGVDNPDGEFGNPLHLAALMVGVIILCFSIGYFFPITTELGLYKMLKL